MDQSDDDDDEDDDDDDDDDDFPTLILNGMNSLCRLCLRVLIYFNRMFNIMFCMPANRGVPVLTPF